jgi:hypothetical protein
LRILVVGVVGVVQESGPASYRSNRSLGAALSFPARRLIAIRAGFGPVDRIVRATRGVVFCVALPHIEVVGNGDPLDARERIAG